MVNESFRPCRKTVARARRRGESRGNDGVAGRAVRLMAMVSCASLGLWAASLLAASLPWGATAHAIGTTQRVVIDHMSGVALYGYDPMSYFTQGVARRGSPKFESRWGGAIWHFANEGNKAAFDAHPELYVPQYGGYCATSISKGRPTSGHPQHFIVHAGKLYLFYSAAQQAIFTMEPDRIVEAADRRWPDIRRLLVP